MIMGYLALTGVSLIVATVLFLSQRNRSSTLNLIYWLIVLVSFGAQGAAGQSPHFVALALLPSVALGFVMLLFFQDVYEHPLPMRHYALLTACLIPLSGVAYLLDFGFIAMSLPLSSAIALPLWHAVYSTWRSQRPQTAAGRFFLIVVAGWCVHMMDYPWLRVMPEAAIPGFCAAFLFGFLMAIFIPAVLVEKIQISLQDTLKAEIALATRDILASKEAISVMHEDKTNLLRVLSHDIRNAMTVFEYLFRKYDTLTTHLKITPTMGDWAKMDLVVETTKLVHNNLRGFIQTIFEVQAHTDKKRLPLHSTASLSKCIAAARALLEQELTQKSIILTVTSDGHDLVIGDEFTLSNSVFANLISNAIKFSETNSKISISSRECGDKIEVRVQDFGIGMSPAIIHDLFDFKAQTNRPGTNNETGTGYGMPIVKQTLLLCGADIKVLSVSREELSKDSKEGAGTTFVIAFEKAVAPIGKAYTSPASG